MILKKRQEDGGVLRRVQWLQAGFQLQAIFDGEKNTKIQVPGSSGSDTLTCLTLHSKASKVIDAAICWNYMVGIYQLTPAHSDLLQGGC